MVNNGAVDVAEKIIAPVQTAFIKDSFILDNVSILHGVLDEIHKRKSDVSLFSGFWTSL